MTKLFHSTAAIALVTATPALAASDASPGDVVMGLFIIALLIVAYFLPTIIAAQRKHHNTGAIFAVNLIFGWAFGIGWVIALIWALTAVKRRDGDGLIG